MQYQDLVNIYSVQKPVFNLRKSQWPSRNVQNSWIRVRTLLNFNNSKRHEPLYLNLNLYIKNTKLACLESACPSSCATSAVHSHVPEGSTPVLAARASCGQLLVGCSCCRIGERLLCSGSPCLEPDLISCPAYSNRFDFSSQVSGHRYLKRLRSAIRKSAEALFMNSLSVWLCCFKLDTIQIMQFGSLAFNSPDHQYRPSKSSKLMPVKSLCDSLADFHRICTFTEKSHGRKFNVIYFAIKLL